MGNVMGCKKTTNSKTSLTTVDEKTRPAPSTESNEKEHDDAKGTNACEWVVHRMASNQSNARTTSHPLRR